MFKSAFFNARYALRDRDACKAGAVVKGIASYARHARRDRNARKAAAVGKSIRSYARHAVADLNGFNFVLIGPPRHRVGAEKGIGEIVHCAGSRDSKRAVLIKLPYKIIAELAGGNVRRRQKVGFRRFFHNGSGNQNDLNRLLFGSLFHVEAALGSFVPLCRGEIGVSTRHEKITAVLLRKNERIHIALRRVDRKRQLFRRARKAHAHRHLRRFRRRLGSRLRRRFHGGFRRRRFRRVGLRIAAGHGLRLLRAAVRRPRRDGELNGKYDRKKHGKPFFHILYAPFLYENAIYYHNIIPFSRKKARNPADFIPDFPKGL